MRRNVSGLLSQFGLSIDSDLLAALIVIASFTVSLAVLILVGAL